jgi:hypothetical protein
MAPGAYQPDPAAHHRSGLSRVLRAVAHDLLAQNDETGLVTHHPSEELLEESRGEVTDLGNRDAGLLGYIKSRES